MRVCISTDHCKMLVALNLQLHNSFNNPELIWKHNNIISDILTRKESNRIKVVLIEMSKDLI